MARPTARPDDETGQRYLTVGWQLVQQKLGYEGGVGSEPGSRKGGQTVDLPEFPVLGLISPTDVVGDETTGGFYRRWSTKAEFYADLVRYILDNSRMRNGTPEQRSRELVMRLADRPTFGEFVHAAASGEMESIKDDPAYAIQLHMWAATRTHEWVRDLMASGYADATDHWSDAYRLVLSLYHMELRPGFDERRLAVLLTALLDGLALRRGIQPDAVDDELFPDGVVALLLGLLEREGDPDRRSLLEAFDDLVGGDERAGFVASGSSRER